MNWYVFYTASRQEKVCEQYLTAEGFTVYLPLSEQLRQWSDRKKKVKVPLFPGYIFVKCMISEITKISGYRGVVGPVRFESGYAIAKEGEIESIRRLLETGVYAEVIPGSITTGDRVIVEEGPLKGQTGQCVLESCGSYLYVEISSVNHTIRCKLTAASLRKL
jgi:transcriptional antiterminator NusG